MRKLENSLNWQAVNLLIFSSFTVNDTFHPLMIIIRPHGKRFFGCCTNFDKEREKKSFQAWRVLKKKFTHTTQKKEALNWVKKDGAKKSRHKRSVKLRGKFEDSMRRKWHTKKSTENSFSCRFSKLSSSIDLTACTKKKKQQKKKNSRRSE